SDPRTGAFPLGTLDLGSQLGPERLREKIERLGKVQHHRDFIGAQRQARCLRPGISELEVAALPFPRSFTRVDDELPGNFVSLGNCASAIEEGYGRCEIPEYDTSLLNHRQRADQHSIGVARFEKPGVVTEDFPRYERPAAEHVNTRIALPMDEFVPVAAGDAVQGNRGHAGVDPEWIRAFIAKLWGKTSADLPSASERKQSYRNSRPRSRFRSRFGRGLHSSVGHRRRGLLRSGEGARTRGNRLGDRLASHDGHCTHGATARD